MEKAIMKRYLALLMAFLLVFTLAPTALTEQTALTLDDLRKQNGDALVYTTNADGCITFLRGSFYDGVIETGDDVEKALIGVAELLGADESTRFMRGACIVDDQNYSYYTFYQWQADCPVQYAIVKVIVDPAGHTAALSSSMVQGVAGNTDTLVSPEQALEAVKARLIADGVNYTYFDPIDKTMVYNTDPQNYGLTIVYVVYTNNPSATLSDNSLAYLAHYVSATGTYLYSMPVSAISDEQAMSGSQADRFFEGMTSAEYTGEVTGRSGAVHSITVPVMLDESSGTYYLGNAERKMLVADFWEFVYNDAVVAPVSSQTNDDWDADSLLAYDNYIQAYDFYNAVGWPSSDGRGTPLLLLTHYVNEEHTPVENACYMGINQGGWQTFAVTSDAFNACEALDIIGHEYTHGVTTASVTDILYENQCGSINESLSDIMGNLMEMLSGRTEDTQWNLGEMGDAVQRSMSDPHSFGQPAYVGDLYYVPDATVPSGINDRGGVHVNNSLLAGIAPKLYQAGMTLEEERLLWTTFICALTPRTGYAEASLILPFAADIAGLSQHQDKIAKAISEIRLDTADPFAVIPDGGTLVTMALPAELDPSLCQIILLGASGKPYLTFPDASGMVRIMVEAGSYAVRVNLFSEAGATTFRFDGKAWTTEEVTDASFEMPENQELALPTEGLEAPAKQTD